MKNVDFHDAVAAFVTVALILGDLTVYIHGGSIPQELASATALAVGYTFRGGVEAALTASTKAG